MSSLRQSGPSDFEQVALPYLHHAYNLARWLASNDQDAEDIVQEAYLRAFRFYCCFRGGDVRPWLLKIVRNTYYTWSQQNRVQQSTESESDFVNRDQPFGNPEELAIQNSSSELLRNALETLSPQFRELLILREFEGLSYKEIANIVGVPTGTVMSRLSRARTRLRQSVADLRMD
ncbi:MAG: sigma-70 family RNA polymerase sigma factor [Acidobacteriaceae bacterium]|nr:sigma-70 family RNA polymerase sigma factor [Acidobacteriaceae bacterium]